MPVWCRPGRIGAWRGATAAMLLAVGGCARPASPPGGPPDARPPVVIATTPEPFADVPEFRGPVRFEFNERISEQASGGTLDDAVTVSPMTGDVRVRHERQGLAVEVGGGFVPGVVYRVTLEPGVQDMFGNALRDPFELVFTTGAVADPTTVAGEVWDRVTGAPMAGARVAAVGPDSLPYVGVSDEEGIYALRYLPAGPYELVAFDDINRNETLDRNEPRGRAPLRLESGDTVFADLPVLAPDSTAPALQAAEVLDSVTVALRFDDHLDPGAPVENISVTLRSDSVGAPGIARRYHEAEYVSFVQVVTDSLRRLDDEAAERRAAARDTAAAPPDTVAAPPDTVAAPPDTAAAPPDTAVAPPDTAAVPPRAAAEPDTPGPRGPVPLPGAAQGGGRDRGLALPGRRIVLVLDAPLVAGVIYEVTVNDVMNINGLGEGGGTVTFEPPAPVTGEGPP